MHHNLGPLWGEGKSQLWSFDGEQQGAGRPRPNGKHLEALEGVNHQVGGRTVSLQRLQGEGHHQVFIVRGDSLLTHGHCSRQSHCAQQSPATDLHVHVPETLPPSPPPPPLPQRPACAFYNFLHTRLYYQKTETVLLLPFPVWLLLCLFLLNCSSYDFQLLCWVAVVRVGTIVLALNSGKVFSLSLLNMMWAVDLSYVALCCVELCSF